MITTKCVGAVTLTETRDALHGAQIPKTPGHWANQACNERAIQVVAQFGARYRIAHGYSGNV